MTGLPLFDRAAADEAAIVASKLSELAASKIPATVPESQILAAIAEHRGHKKPISIATLHQRTGLGERVIKDAVFELVVTHKIMIGASRGNAAGYYMIESAEDQELAAGPYEAQIIAMLRRLRVLRSPHKVREFLGQRMVELG